MRARPIRRVCVCVRTHNSLSSVDERERIAFTFILLFVHCSGMSELNASVWWARERVCDVCIPYDVLRYTNIWYWIGALSVEHIFSSMHKTWNMMRHFCIKFSTISWESQTTTHEANERNRNRRTAQDQHNPTRLRLNERSERNERNWNKEFHVAPLLVLCGVVQFMCIVSISNRYLYLVPRIEDWLRENHGFVFFLSEIAFTIAQLNSIQFISLNLCGRGSFPSVNDYESCVCVCIVFVRAHSDDNNNIIQLNSNRTNDGMIHRKMAKNGHAIVHHVVRIVSALNEYEHITYSIPCDDNSANQ